MKHDTFYIVTVNFIDPNERYWDTFIGGIYLTVTDGIYYVNKWFNESGYDEIEWLPVANDTDFAHFKVRDTEEEGEIYFSIEPYYLNDTIPSCF